MLVAGGVDATTVPVDGGALPPLAVGDMTASSSGGDLSTAAVHTHASVGGGGGDGMTCGGVLADENGEAPVHAQTADASTLVPPAQEGGSKRLEPAMPAHEWLESGAAHDWLESGADKLHAAKERRRASRI